MFDRALSFGYQGVLATDVKAALYDSPGLSRPLVLGELAGFGGREVTIETARGIVARARRALDGEPIPPDQAEFVGLKRELLPVGRP